MYKGMVKDGLHIVVPGVVTRPAVQFLIRNDVLAALPHEVSYRQLGLLNRVEDVVDESVIERNNWMMYGSKKPHGEVYMVTHRFRYRPGGRTSLCTDVEGGGSSSTRFVDLFSIRNKHAESRLRADKREHVDVFVAQQDEKRKRREAVQAVMSIAPNVRSNTCDNLDQVTKLVALLDVARAESYNDWVRVGWCLRNIDHRLLDTWVDFSRRSSKYIDGECPRLWDYMRQGGLGIGTLHMWARQDSPEAYRTLLRCDLTELILRSANGSHHDVARVVHHMYRYEYVCSSIRHRSWYEFREHRWRESDSAYTLRRRLSTDVFREYNMIATQMQARSMASNEDAEQTRLLETCQKLNAIALMLKKTNFKDNVIRECCELFMVEGFEEQLDSNCSLLGFENGIYDLDAFEFRDGRPDDHVSFSTGIHYVPYDDNHPTVRDIKRFWDQIHPDPEIRCYVLRTLASCLSGFIPSERFNIWTGTGSNGKSLCVNLMEKSFGDYCCKFPVTLLTQKRAASNAACSEIARAKGRRFGVLQEPSEDEHLNIGLMKELSGGDKIQCRELYKAPVEWRPQFKLFLLCNHLPTVPSEDGGTWRRIRVVEFGSKFVDKPTKPNEFLIDPELARKLDDWKEHFIAMLIDYHRRFSHTKIEDPELVMMCTREYQRNNDHMADFIDTFVRPSSDPADHLTIDILFREFREWVKRDNIPAKGTRRRDLQTYMDRNLARHCKVNGRVGYRGYRIGDDADPAEDDMGY